MKMFSDHEKKKSKKDKKKQAEPAEKPRDLVVKIKLN